MSVVVLLSLFALLPFATPSFAQEPPVAASGLAAEDAGFETSDALAAQYTEALAMMYAWGAIREDFLKHPEEPASRYDGTYTAAQFLRHFLPNSYADFQESLNSGRSFSNGAFPNFPARHWAEESMEFLYYCSILEGMPEGNGRWESADTRYEAAMAVSRVGFIESQSLRASGLALPDYGFDAYERYLESADMQASAGKVPFIDVPEDHWAYFAVLDLYVSGVLPDEFEDSNFRGNDNISRASLALWYYRLAQALDLESFVETEPILTPTDSDGTDCGG
jgi:hypothetical protein